MNIANIADSLGILTGKHASWTVDSDDSVARDDGLTFWIREGGYGNEGRIAISFSRPRGVKGEYITLWEPKNSGKVSDPRITVANTKSDDQIAKDILRRLVADSEVVFKLAKDRIIAESNFYSGKEKTIRLMASLCGTEPERHYQSKELTFEIDPFKGARVPSFKEHGYGKIKVSSEDSVTIELTSVGVDTASEIVSAIHKILSAKASA